ncbi:MAG: hypothetical protein IKU45_00635 [Clostridia bacterium]|nr:hypothetical protein [Clostridia bacterium]
MSSIKRELEEILAKLEEQQPEIDRILRRTALVDTGRKPKELCRIPNDADFVQKDGNTEYEVVGYFDSEGEEYLIDTIVRKLGYKFYEET